MNPITGTLRGRSSIGTAIVLVMSLALAGDAWADGIYPPDGTKPDGPGAYQNPNDGMCVVGIAPNGTMLVDWSITKSRDCVAYTTGLSGMANSASCTIAGAVTNSCTAANTPWACCTGNQLGTCTNDGYKHTWSTSLCYDSVNNTGISRIDLDNTETMCLSKGGTIVTTGKCVANGWVYRNRKSDGSLPISGSGVAPTNGVQFSDGLGFCYAAIRMTGGAFNASAAVCPSFHNSAVTAPADWPACLSSAAGCQTQDSYNAGLGWSFASANCVYTYGVKGVTNAAVTKADGTSIPIATSVDLTTTDFDTQGECLASGFSWDNWLPNTSTTTKTNADAGFEGMPSGAVIRKLDALTDVEDGGGDFYSGTGAVCQKCHSDQSRSYQERNKPGFPETRHKLAGDATGKPFQPYFTAAGSDWGLQGVQCAMCHSTSKPAKDDLIQVQPAGYSSNPNTACTAAGNPYPCCTGAGAGTCAIITAGAPKSATGHNQTEYGTHLIDICYTCHGTPASPVATNPASVIPVAGTDFANTAKGLAPITNQFLNSPHAEYAGSSSKVDVGDRTKYGSSFEGWVCRVGIGKLSATTYPNAAACTGAGLGYAWYTTTNNGSFCYHTPASCAALPGGQWATTFAATTYPWAADTGGPGAVCGAVGSGSIITTVYRNGVAEKIHNLDSTINTMCTNPGDGSANSGAGGVWVKDGETSPGSPADTAQGNCMTCHDVHWALASTDPEAEPIRRECTTCHSNTGPSASSAPQINLATINHLPGVGTPLEHMATKPYEACEICHMPRSTAGNSPMHLWRISTDSNYVTLTGAQVPTDAGGKAWVDLDHACGQCHGGGTAQGPGYQPVPPALYRTRAALAAVADGIHASSGVNYAVTFSTAVNALNVSVNAVVDCGGPFDPNNPSVPDPTCPPLTYDWNWGDGSGHGSGDLASHGYATPVCVGGTAAGALCSSNATCTGGGSCALKYAITLIVNLNGQQVGAPVTRGVILTAPDLPPIAGGTCTWTADTWTMQLVDSSTDAPNPPPHVVVDWGDGTRSSVVAGGTISKAYTRVGSFPVTQTASDNLGQSDTRTCATATPAYFTIGGTVRSSGGTGIPSALVTLKKRAANGTYVTVASTVTSATGSYSFASIKPARYSITATKTGYVFTTAPEFSVGPSATVDVSATAPAAVLSPRHEGMDNAN